MFTRPTLAALLISSFAIVGTTAATATEPTPACDLPAGVLTIEDLPEGESAVECDAIGRTVEIGDELSLPIPDAGEGVRISLEYGDAPPKDFAITTSLEGEVEYFSGSNPEETGDEAAVEETAEWDEAADDEETSTAGEPDDSEPDPLSNGDTTTGSGPAACSDGAYTDKDEKQYYQWLWYLGDGARPIGMSTDTVISRLKDSVDNITASYNDCNYTDQVSASASYQGVAAQESQIIVSGGENTCASHGDSRSVVDFGNLDGHGNPPLATECTWSATRIGANNSITSSDVRFNTANYAWTNTTTGCSNKFDLEAVATHEFGHSFGLGHVSESAHGSLTMSTQTSPCSTSQRTLGKGDILSLRNTY